MEDTGRWVLVWFAGRKNPMRRRLYMSDGRWYVTNKSGRDMVPIDTAMGYVFEEDN